MELVKKAREPIVPRKRPSDDSNDQFRNLKSEAFRDFPPGCGIKEADRKPFKKLTNVHSKLAGKMTDENNKLNSSKSNEFGSRPAGKVQFWDPTCSENQGTQKPKVTTTVASKRLPLKHLDNSRETNIGKSVKSQHLQHDNKFKKNIPSFGAKPAGKVKFWEPPCSKAGHKYQPEVTTTIVRKLTSNSEQPVDNKKPSFGSKEQAKRETIKEATTIVRKLTSNDEQTVDKNKPSVGSKEQAKRVKIKEATPIVRKLTSNDEQTVDNNNPSVGSKEQAMRVKIKEAITIFDEVYTKLYQENKLKPKGEKMAHWRVPIEAAKLVKQMLKLMEPEKQLGPICGVQIGDRFKYRSQLKMIGLHFQPQSGIDYTNIEGKNLALSIVDAHRYSNNSSSSDMLVYCGQGGLKFLGPKLPPEDQKLKRGNLALKNSMDERTPVRVIRKLEGFEKTGVFVYDGLYMVNHYTEKRNEEGNIVFNFHLNRVPGQPPLHQMLNANP